MRLQLGKIGAVAMRVGLVGSLVLVMLFFLRDAMQGRVGSGDGLRKANVDAGPTPEPLVPSGVGDDQADRLYRFLNTQGLVVAGAKGLAACADRRVVPLLVAVCDGHDPSLAEHGLTPSWAAEALSTLLDVKHGPPDWVRWFARNRAEYADCRFLHRYQVRRGDTLWRISRRVYGSGDHTQRLHERNLALIPDPDQLVVGTVLVVP
jgi:LysM domain-containing protein